VSLERGPFSVVSATEELLRKNSSSIRHTDYATPHYEQKLALTSPTSGGPSVGIIRSRTEATELVNPLVQGILKNIFIKFCNHIL
jgi:hypothetical protein